MVLFGNAAFAQRHSGGGGGDAGNEGFGATNQIELGGDFSYRSDNQSVSQTNNNQTTNTSTTTSTFSFEPTIGWFPGWIQGAQFELGIRPIYISTASNGESLSTFVLMAEPTIYFDTHSIVHPYAQGGIGFCSYSAPEGDGGSYSGSGFAYRIAGGIKLSLAPRSLLNVDLEWADLNEGSDNGVGVSDGFFTIAVGYSIVIN